MANIDKIKIGADTHNIAPTIVGNIPYSDNIESNVSYILGTEKNGITPDKIVRYTYSYSNAFPFAFCVSVDETDYMDTVSFSLSDYLHYIPDTMRGHINITLIGPPNGTGYISIDGASSCFEVDVENGQYVYLDIEIVPDIHGEVSASPNVGYVLRYQSDTPVSVKPGDMVELGDDPLITVNLGAINPGEDPASTLGSTSIVVEGVGFFY